jgi:excisionase family DNA binding protein
MNTRPRQTHLERLAYTATEAPSVLGISDDFFRQHVAGELKWVRRGSKKLVSRRELEAWLEREAALTLPPQGVQ